MKYNILSPTSMLLEFPSTKERKKVINKHTEPKREWARTLQFFLNSPLKFTFEILLKFSLLKLPPPY